MKKLVTAKDLELIFSNAKDNFVNDSAGHLNEQQFRAKCFMNAVLNYLNISDVKFETRLPVESIED